jgi:hypothetical protein
MIKRTAAAISIRKSFHLVIKNVINVSMPDYQQWSINSVVTAKRDKSLSSKARRFSQMGDIPC